MKLSKQEKEDLKAKALDYLQTCQKDMDKLASDRKDALAAYMQELYGNEVSGRSQIVMSDVQDTVEWIMPSLMRIFYGGPEVVTCSPVGGEDVDKARLMEGKLNFDFQKSQTPGGFLILHDWFKDALLMRAGVVKYYWKTERSTRFKEFVEVDEIQLSALRANPRFEIDETEPIRGEPDEQGLVPITYNVTGTITEEFGKPCAEALAPEEVIFRIRDKDSKSAEFVAHRRKMHVNEVKTKFKLTDDDIVHEFEAIEHDQDVAARFKDLGGLSFLSDDPNREFVYVYECYLYHYDKKGRKVPQIATIFGDEVIKVQANKYGRPPFCFLSPIRMAHRIVGRSIFDLVGELQKLRTALVRHMLDNVYYQNNGVNIINPYRLNLNDLNTQNVPGGNIRTLYDVDPRTAVFPMPQHPLPTWTFSLLELSDEWRENRTGVTRYNQGMDAKSLNKTAQGINQIMGASQARIEMIARVFAETGVKDLFEAFRDMNLQFFDGVAPIKLNEEWVNVRPEDIDGKFDIIVDVGIGTGTREYQIGQLINLMNLSVPVAQMGIVTPQNIYELLKEIYRAMGRKDVERFITEPAAGGMLTPELMAKILEILQQNGVNVQGLVQAAAAQLQQGGGQGKPQSMPSQPNPQNGGYSQ